MCGNAIDSYLFFSLLRSSFFGQKKNLCIMANGCTHFSKKIITTVAYLEWQILLYDFSAGAPLNKYGPICLPIRARKPLKMTANTRTKCSLAVIILISINCRWRRGSRTQTNKQTNRTGTPENTLALKSFYSKCEISERFQQVPMRKNTDKLRGNIASGDMKQRAPGISRLKEMEYQKGTT